MSNQVPTKTILKVLAGSRAYGLEDADSDYDYHAVFVVPTSDLLRLGPKPKETDWVEGASEDYQAWEIGHFLRLATHCNPTIIETFVAPVEGYDPVWGMKLLELFPHVLSKKRVYDAFRGYAKNQRTKMFDPKGGVRAGERVWKFSVAHLRVLWHGIILLDEGTYFPAIEDGPFKRFLLDVKVGKVSRGDIINRAESLELELTETYLDSSLPEEPNLEVVNEFLLDLRKEYWRFE